MTNGRSFRQSSFSNTSWVPAAQIPGLRGGKAKRSIAPTPAALMAAIEGYRARAEKAGRNAERAIAIYAAGWSGFWLVRWLAKHGIETHGIQPSSVPVDRRARRAKSDGQVRWAELARGSLSEA